MTMPIQQGFNTGHTSFTTFLGGLWLGVSQQKHPSDRDDRRRRFASTRLSPYLKLNKKKEER
jgi:hypothetical protein